MKKNVLQVDYVLTLYFGEKIKTASQLKVIYYTLQTRQNLWKKQVSEKSTFFKFEQLHFSIPLHDAKGEINCFFS